MTDGTVVPRTHDGMGAFVGPAGTWRLIRNHEVRNAPGDNTLAMLGPQETKYDPLGVGGTVTLDGGTLEMLAVIGRPNYNTLTGQTVGASLAVRWVPIADPDPNLEDGQPEVAAQGLAGGGALFNRLKGIWWDFHTRTFFFASTSGGNAGCGQIWQYDPARETLTLFFESPGGTVLDSPDNLHVTPRGGILLCEDDATGQDNDIHPLAPGIVDVNRIIGLTPDAKPFEFAINRLNDSEPAGAGFSPDSRTLFFNIFGDSQTESSMTCAVTGPWQNGPL